MSENIQPKFDDLTSHIPILNEILSIEEKNAQLLQKLESLRINPTDELLPPEVAWSLLNTKTDNYDTLGTLGNFSLIIGKAKAKKSFFINIAVTTALSTDDFLGRFKNGLKEDKRKVLYFDTEQGKYHVQLAVKRICKQTGVDEPDNLFVYGLRSQSPQERLKLIEYAVNNIEDIGLVVIDGVKDLITSINDEEQASMVSSKFLKWTEEKNIHIITVLHQNKSDTNARGHIGTELINKAETVLSVTRDEKNGDISIVEPQQCRNREPETFAFELDENALPVLVDGFEKKVATKKTTTNDLIDCDVSFQIEILEIVFKREKLISYGELVRQIGLAFKKKYNNTTIGTNKIKDFITHAKNEDLIFQSKLKAPYQLRDVKV